MDDHTRSTESYRYAVAFLRILSEKEEWQGELARQLREFEGGSGALTVLGLGAVVFEVKDGRLDLASGEPGRIPEPWLRIDAEALYALGEGWMDVVEACFKGDLVLEAERHTLERIYDLSTWLQSVTRESPATRALLAEIRDHPKARRINGLEALNSVRAGR